MMRKKISNHTTALHTGIGWRLAYIAKILLSGTVLYLFLITTSSAQLQLSPLPKKNPTHAATPKSTARTQSISPLELPFWDDFSVFARDANGNPTGYPDTLHWENSNSVWVNAGMGINPPSINVATLDGLDSTNEAYEPSQILINGYTDKLQSLPIKLTSIPAENQDSVFLRFFYQWQGNGEAPDKTDYLVLEFKDQTSIWRNVLTVYPKENPDKTIFYDTTIRIDETQGFFHDGFQFRFRRYGRKSGPFDTWNIDYVYLNHFHPNDFNSISDRAMSSQLSSFLAPYWSVPYKHWLNDKLFSHPGFQVKNNKNSAVLKTMNYSTWAKVSNYKSNKILLSKDSSILDTPFSTGFLVSSLSAENLVTTVFPDTNLFDPSADSVILTLKAGITSNDMDPSFDYSDYYKPINFFINDTITSTSTLNNYYAFDDGIAEYAVFLANSGNAAAYRFDLLIPQDTLIGFYVYFPDYGIITSQSVKFGIYNDNNGLPTDNPIFQPTVTIQKKGLNIFTKVLLSKPLIIKDKFYIGWTESTSGSIKVGLDRNNNTSDRIFQKNNGLWSAATKVDGSLMIRPIFGGSSEIITGLPPTEPASLTLYPNPNQGTFYVRGHYDALNVISTTGQAVNFTVEDLGEETRISLHGSTGLYLVTIRTGKEMIIKKIIIR